MWCRIGALLVVVRTASATVTLWWEGLSEACPGVLPGLQVIGSGKATKLG